jgi:hypothetical protein
MTQRENENIKINSNQESLNSKGFSKIYKTIHSFIFDLPFENYNEYYKTGIIQKMSKEQKIQFLIDKNLHKQHRQFFTYFINLRPNILDDDDACSYRETLDVVNRYNTFVFIGFFLNWTYFSYNFFVNKRLLYKPLIIFNGLLFFAYIRNNNILSVEQNRLFEKYKNIFKREEILNVFKESYRIDKI